jgi:CRP/FNR family cyclic AMP-dependent transcriptional regulator
VITTVEKVLFLKSIDLFRALPGEDLAQIAEIATEVPVGSGGLVFGEGEPGDALYIVVEGRVKVFRGEKVLAELGERECFGEMSVLDSEPRSASVSAVSEALLLKIGREEFKDILSERPEISLGIMKVLSRRLREANVRSK